MSDYWVGVLTPIVFIGGTLLIASFSYLLYKAANYLNSKTHYKLIARVEIGRNKLRTGEPKDDRPQHWDKATQLRDALLKSPRIWRIVMFGHILLIVRDSEEVKRREGKTPDYNNPSPKGNNHETDD